MGVDDGEDTRFFSVKFFLFINIASQRISHGELNATVVHEHSGMGGVRLVPR